MFDPPIALASLSGRSDADWARAGVPWVGAAFLGGIAIDAPTRRAARAMVARDRNEFLPADPIRFIDDQLAGLESVDIRPGFNVRAVTTESIERAARVCRDRGAILEVNAHCRQPEMCRIGAGEPLLRDGDRLARQIETAAGTGATVSVKVRAEVPGVDLVAVAGTVEAAGGAIVHVDAMDSESIIEPIAASTDLFLVANNGVRDRPSTMEYLGFGADAVSVGRASDDPAVLRRVRRAVDRAVTGSPTEPP